MLKCFISGQAVKLRVYTVLLNYSAAILTEGTGCYSSPEIWLGNGLKAPINFLINYLAIMFIFSPIVNYL